MSYGMNGWNKPGGDLISRQAAIDALNKLDVSDGVGISSIACGVQELAIISIQHLPSAERHGKWIIFNDDDPDLSSFKCSSCGTHFSIDAVFDNYCPHCGARMEGE